VSSSAADAGAYPDRPVIAAVDAFVHAATEQRRSRAEALLAGEPEIASDPWARLVLGRGGWDGDPVAPGGPRGWAPLLYVCHSCFASVPLARSLLEAGADPNVTFTNEYGEMSALYGAAGRVHDPELTRLLLEAGADPDDGESLYYSTEAEDPACLALLLEHGAETRGTHALAHALDEERLEHVRLLLDAGADPSAGALIAHAVRRGRGAEFVTLLAEHGADLERPGGESWRGDVPRRTPYQHAVLRGKRDVADLLAGLGASTAVDPADEAIGALARGERPAGTLPAAPDVDQQEVLILAALRGHLDLVLEHVDPGFTGVVGGSPPGTLLHHAAWVGNADVARTLLARGADPDARVPDPPLAWAAHGSQWPGRDHVGVAEALTAAGATPEPRHLEVADGPLAAWLEARLSA
jgi:ankyrin repeat protein